MSEWQRAGENLVKHSNGTYYLRAKVLGKGVRVSLKTKDLRIAKIKRDERLGTERVAMAARKPGDSRTMSTAIAVLKIELADRSHIRPKTRTYWLGVIKTLTETLPVDAHGKTWSQAEAAAWWAKIGKRYSASVANKLLAAIKRLSAIMVERGIRSDDPTRDLKRMPGKKIHRKMPSRSDIDAIVHHMRMQRWRLCLESSRLVAFIAYSGLRKGEAHALTWADVGPDWITVGAGGNTKSKRFRQVPISEPLRAVLDEMRDECDIGPLFEISEPRRALNTAIKALGLPPMRVHDLRHFFATWCIESGVDIPTVAKWLGHSDGGALAMKTYGHVRDDHSLEAVKRLG